MPAAIGIIARRRSDVMLAELVRDFMDAIGLDGGVKIGQTAIEIEEDLDWEIC